MLVKVTNLLGNQLPYLPWATIHMLVQVHLEGVLPLHYLSWLNEPTTNRRLFFPRLLSPKFENSTLHIEALLFVCTCNRLLFLKHLHVKVTSVLHIRLQFFKHPSGKVTNLLGNHIPYLLCATYHIVVQVHMQLALPPHGLTWMDEPPRKRRLFYFLCFYHPNLKFEISPSHVSHFTLGTLIWSMDRM